MAGKRRGMSNRESDSSEPAATLPDHGEYYRLQRARDLCRRAELLRRWHRVLLIGFRILYVAAWGIWAVTFRPARLIWVGPLALVVPIVMSVIRSLHERAGEYLHEAAKLAREHQRRYGPQAGAVGGAAFVSRKALERASDSAAEAARERAFRAVWRRELLRKMRP